jgi:hypothetical protein
MITLTAGAFPIAGMGVATILETPTTEACPLKQGERIAIRNANTSAVLSSEVKAVEYARIKGGERYAIVFGDSIASEEDVPPGSILVTVNDGLKVVSWLGDLDDDCTGFLSGVLLRAEEMDRDSWWWAATDLFGSGRQIGSSNDSGENVPDGLKARELAETCARNHLDRQPRS